MKTQSSYFYLVLAVVTLFFCITTANAQRTPPPDGAKQDFAPPAEQQRPNLLGELGLSPEQTQQLRRMNVERKPRIDAANRRLREANRNLDQLIYGDAVDDAEFQTRLRSFQAHKPKWRGSDFESELKVRRILLTPDQLVKFREIRRQFAETRREMKQQNAPMQSQRPFRKLNRGLPPPRTTPN
jgi:Spy/CpxP family protein refolding chaperone